MASWKTASVGMIPGVPKVTHRVGTSLSVTVTSSTLWFQYLRQNEAVFHTGNTFIILKQVPDTSELPIEVILTFAAQGRH